MKTKKNKPTSAKVVETPVKRTVGSKPLASKNGKTPAQKKSAFRISIGSTNGSDYSFVKKELDNKNAVMELVTSVLNEPDGAREVIIVLR